MQNTNKLLSCLLLLCFFLSILSSISVRACKDIIACGDATEGDYNLLLKVRDPSRPGLQVLSIVPEEYEYTYQHPWTGKSISFKTEHKFIGVATKDDVIPNIVKAGMALSETGVSYGDSDTNSRWINPTKNAWDDFDWIRYACEQAESEDEAVNLLTKECVDKLHATGVSENLFVVGPDKGYIVEADAFRYKIEEISNGVAVRHNYPKLLWKSQIQNMLPISKSFDIVEEKDVRKRGVVRLGSVYGVRVTEIGNDYITVSPVGFVQILRTNNIGIITKIQIGERKTVGYFSVELLEINGNKARIRVTNVYKAWEEKMLEHISSRYSSITVNDMIYWTRLHKEDLDSLRPMCQDSFTYETSAIFKIPNKNYETLCMGWFAPNHACSSIYVPFHVFNTDIFDPFETGEAAQLSLSLLEVYGHDFLSDSFNKTEDVFLNEINDAEQITTGLQVDKSIVVPDFLTIIDMGMQRQAYYTEEMWIDASKISDNQKIIEVITNIWKDNYTVTLNMMKTAILDLEKISESIAIKEKIADIALDICKSRIDAAETLGKQISSAEEEYQKGIRLIERGEYEQGFNSIQKAFTECDMLLKGQSLKVSQKIKTEEKPSILLYLLLVLLVIVILIVLFKKKQP